MSTTRRPRSRARDLYLINGQSNGTSNSGQPGPSIYALNTGPTTYNAPVSPFAIPFAACSLPGVIPGVRDNTAPTTPATLLPCPNLREGLDVFDGTAGEDVIHGETISTAAATFLWQRTRRRSWWGCCARDGAGYSSGTGAQAQGNSAYNWGKEDIAAASYAYGQVGRVRGVCCVHGEQDAVLGAATTTVTANTSFTAGSFTLNTAAFTVKSAITSPYGFANGGYFVAQTSVGDQYFTYTGATSGQFTGCVCVSGVSGTLYAGATVYRADYLNDLITWQSNLQTDLGGITKQDQTVAPINLYAWQQCVYSNGNSSSVGKTALMLYVASQLGYINVVAPGYVFPGSIVGGGSLHLGCGGERWLGEQFAKVIWRTAFLGQPWTPLRPTAINRTGAVISLTYGSAIGGLSYDARLVKWAPNWGYTYADAGGSIGVASVAMGGSNVVNVTLTGTPSGGQWQVIRNGWSPITLGAMNEGETRTNLRDNDPEPSSYGYPLYNFALCSEDAVP